jgi:hypothetical protein
MANPTQSLTIKNGAGETTYLAVGSGSQGLIPFHAIYGSTEVTASEQNPLSVTGTVKINNFPSVQTITASLSNQVGVTGSVTLNGTSTITGTVNVNNFPSTQAITASFSSPVAVTGAVTLNGTSNVTGTVNVNNFPATQTVTSSNTYPVYQANAAGSTLLQTVSSSFNGWNTTASGTFRLADLNTSRRELMIYNSGPGNLYVALGATSLINTDRYGFTLTNTASAPSSYSFVIYPSGTYMTSEASRVLHHGGYFISGSASTVVSVTNIS